MGAGRRRVRWRTSPRTTAQRGRRRLLRLPRRAARWSTSGPGSPIRATAEPWARDTLQLVFSTTKGATAICAHLLAQRGELDLDAPDRRRCGPSSARTARRRSRSGSVIAHRAGLAAIDGDLTLADVLAWEPVVARDRGAGAELGAGDRAGVPRPRRTGSSSARSSAASPAARSVGSSPTRSRGRSDSTSGSGCPRPRSRASRRSSRPPPRRPRGDGRVLPAPTRSRVGPCRDRRGCSRTTTCGTARALHAAELPSSNGIATARGRRAHVRGDGRAARRRPGRRRRACSTRRRSPTRPGAVRRDRPDHGLPDADRDRVHARADDRPGRARARSATPVPAARSASPTPRPSSASGT